MKKINGFTITKLTMTGFKCFEDTVSFDIGDTTFITASNGQGKSSIADAIAFAFAGTPFFGDRGLDRLQNKNADEMSVSIDFADYTGEIHNLTRTRKRDLTSISYDGLTVRQSDLNSAFGDKDVFLSILNPLYFTNVLGDSGKGLLEKLLPTVKHDDVLAALPESSRDVLAEHKLSSPEAFIKKQRSELKEIEDTLIGYRSQKELLDLQRDERTGKLAELRSSIEMVTVEMDELISIRDNGRDISAEESALDVLRKHRSELLSDTANKETDREVKAVTKEIRSVEKHITKLEAEQYKSSFTERIAETEAGLKALYDEHGRVTKALSDTVVGYKCPTCMIEITEDNIEAVKNSLRDRLAVLVDDGKTAKINLAGIKSQDNRTMDGFIKEKALSIKAENDKLEALNQQLQELNVSRELDNDEQAEQLIAIDNQIGELEYRLANGNWSQEQIQQYGELSEMKKGYEIQIDTLSNVTDYDFASRISETEADVQRIKRLIAESIQYLVKRTELMLDGLKMSNTEIVLTETVKTTGEIKDCFRFSYDGRDYKCLSLSEKVRAGLDVATLIQRLSGRNYPIFVDNGESICSFGSVHLNGQVIIARVANKQPLQVSYRNRESERTAA